MISSDQDVVLVKVHVFITSTDHAERTSVAILDATPDENVIVREIVAKAPDYHSVTTFIGVCRAPADERGRADGSKSRIGGNLVVGTPADYPIERFAGVPKT